MPRYRIKRLELPAPAPNAGTAAGRRYARELAGALAGELRRAAPAPGNSTNRVRVTLPPGGAGADAVARAVGQQLRERRANTKGGG